MLRLENLSKSYWYKGVRRTIISNLNLTLPPGRSMALLGGNGAGKTTLLEIIAGVQKPDTGRVVTDGSVSWPVGFSGSFNGDMTGRQNTIFVARVYGIDTRSLLRFVSDFAELGVQFDAPVRTYSSGMKARLSFGLSMGIQFDTYLVDETTAVGDARFNLKSRAVFRERIRNASAIMVSHQTRKVKDYCDAALVLHQGRLEYFDDLEEGVAYHEALMARA